MRLSGFFAGDSTINKFFCHETVSFEVIFDLFSRRQSSTILFFFFMVQIMRGQ